MRKLAAPLVLNGKSETVFALYARVREGLIPKSSAITTMLRQGRL
jgi:hypothetical protein